MGDEENRNYGGQFRFEGAAFDKTDVAHTAGTDVPKHFQDYKRTVI